MFRFAFEDLLEAADSDSGAAKSENLIHFPHTKKKAAKHNFARQLASTKYSRFAKQLKRNEKMHERCLRNVHCTGTSTKSTDFPVNMNELINYVINGCRICWRGMRMRCFRARVELQLKRRRRRRRRRRQWLPFGFSLSLVILM